MSAEHADLSKRDKEGYTMTFYQSRPTFASFKAHWIRTSPSLHLATLDSPSQATISDKMLPWHSLKLIHSSLKSTVPTFMTVGQLGQHNFTILHKSCMGCKFNRHARVALWPCNHHSNVCLSGITYLHNILYKAVFSNECQSSILSK